MREAIKRKQDMFRLRLAMLKERRAAQLLQKHREMAKAWEEELKKAQAWKDECLAKSCNRCKLVPCACRPAPKRAVGSWEQEWRDWNRGREGSRKCGPALWANVVRAMEDGVNEEGVPYGSFGGGD